MTKCRRDYKKMKKERILIVRANPYEENIKNYNVQGIGIARAFCKLGYDCDYLTYTKKESGIIHIYETGGCKARVIYKKWYRVLRTGISFESLKNDFLSSYDYIICREYNQIMTYLIARNGRSVSMYSGPYWNMFMIPFFSLIYDFLFIKWLDRNLICKFVKSKMAEDFLKKKGMRNLIDLGVGLDIDIFQSEEPNEEVSSISEYMRENECLLYIGSLNDNKNLPFLIELFKYIRKRRKEIKLVLIGKSEQTLINKILGKKNETYFQEIYDKLSYDIKKGIIHIEQIENAQLKYIYPYAKVFLLPSKKEIFGMVLLEAMYFKIPVITTNNGGSSTLIKSNKLGQVIDKYDVRLWASGIERYLSDSTYTNEVCDNAYKNIIENYSWNKIAEKMIENIKKTK